MWIGGDGTVLAITGYEEVTAANIQQFLKTPEARLAVKQDEEQVAYDKNKPLFINHNGGNGQAMSYHSLIGNYTPGLPAGGSVTRDSITGTKLSFRNVPLITLFRMAYWDKHYFPDNRTVLEVHDPSNLDTDLSGSAYLDWLSAGNGYTYELCLPPALNGKESDFMRSDLDRYFTRYKAAVESRKIRCLALVRTSAVDRIKTTGGKPVADFSPNGFTIQNLSVWALIQRMNQLYLRNSKLPLVDGTGYAAPIDLSVAADLGSVEALNQALKKYDLTIEERTMEADVLVIRDRTP